MWIISRKIEQQIEQIVKPVIEDAGYEYVGVEIKNTGDAKELIVYADAQGALSLNDCEKISRLIDPKIEQADPIEDAYYLCVSSPGLDRPLKTAADFARSIGKAVDIKLYRPQGKRKEFTGRLKSFSEQGFCAEIDGSDKEFTYKDTAIVRLHVDINRGGIL